MTKNENRVKQIYSYHKFIIQRIYDKDNKYILGFKLGNDEVNGINQLVKFSKKNG